jgi:2-polyprenyl-3-methyl-5-hydroxy-6-metoxy-1,4-benzoquinol methylase
VSSGSDAIDALDDQPLRVISFKQILDECTELIPSGGPILDVGCAHGWFMEAAEARGYGCSGIEPDDDMASRLQASNIGFMKGYFPEVVPAGVKYDAITFNEVFEHLPNLSVMVTAVRDHLNENGVLIINLPVSDGIFLKLHAASRESGPSVHCAECGKRDYLLRILVIFPGRRFLSCC